MVVREVHQLIRIKDIIPTPSHPMNSWNKFPAQIKTTMANRKISKALVKVFVRGVGEMYQVANSMIDQATNRTIGRRRAEK